MFALGASSPYFHDPKKAVSVDLIPDSQHKIQRMLKMCSLNKHSGHSDWQSLIPHNILPTALYQPSKYKVFKYFGIQAFFLILVDYFCYQQSRQYMENIITIFR